MARILGWSVLFWIPALLIALTISVAGDCGTGDVACETVGRENAFWGTLAFFALLYFSVIVGLMYSRWDER